MFVLFKNILIFISAVIDLRMIIQKEWEIEAKLLGYVFETQIKGNEEIENLVNELIKSRWIWRFRWLEFCSSTFRIIMLVFKLEINIYGLYLNPIMYSLSGLSSTIINIFRQIIK